MRTVRKIMVKKVTCEVILDGLVLTEPIEVKTYGIEVIYAVDIEFQSTKTKKGVININYSNSLGLELKPGDMVKVKGDLRSIRVENDAELISKLEKVDGEEPTVKPRKVYVLVRELEKLDKLPTDMTNVINFEQLLVTSKPVTRKSYTDATMDITSFKVRSERNKDKSSVLFCTAWNSLARLTSELDTGVRINGQGNLQSRYSHGWLYNEICISSLSIAE